MNRTLQDSKIISIMYENQKSKDRLTLRQQNKSKMVFMTIEHHRDKISRKMKNYRRIADEIACKINLIDSTSIDDYLLKSRSIKTSANNRATDKIG